MVCVLCGLLGCATAPDFRHTTTAELRLRWGQDAEFINRPYEPSLARQHRTHEKEVIEHELLRRYEAGETNAYLAIFQGQISPATTRSVDVRVHP